MSAMIAEAVGKLKGSERIRPPQAPVNAAEPKASCAMSAEEISRNAQQLWAAQSFRSRLQIIRGTRQWIAARAQSFAEAIAPDLHRSHADTLATELLPLLDAMRFLERRAYKLLTPQKLGRAGRPLWLSGVKAEVHRVPFGHLLVIGPANYPLFLPAVQTMQALAAGNAVTWKPGTGGRSVALLVEQALRESGLPDGVLRVTGEGLEDAQHALGQGPDKVIFTGSFESGRAVLQRLADSATPSVMELSGADAVVVLPSADLALSAKAIAFGLRLNGAEVCMSPRRLIATPETMRALRPLLDRELDRVPPIRLKARTAATLKALLEDAVACGARVCGIFSPEAQRPVLIEDAEATMKIACSDVFAPVLTLLEAPSLKHIPEIINECPYGLTASVFGEECEARAMGERLRVGAITINDLIAPTVDPRVPFGGRGQSGFGATRGAEGLLEMTAPKTILVRRKGLALHYGAVGWKEAPLFAAAISALHGDSLKGRMRAVRQLIGAARRR